MPKVIEHIVSQYAEEASFLWLLRDQAINLPHYELKELAGLDRRIDAHIDGLRIAGDAGWEMCKNELIWNQAGEVFAAAVIALESGVEERIQLVLEAASQDLELARGFISAIGWLKPEQAIRYIEGLLKAESAIQRRMGIAGAAIHRIDPGSALEGALRHEDPVLRARALQACGELGRTDLAYIVASFLKDGDADCRFHAARAGMLLGLPDAIPVMQYFVEEAGAYAEEAARIVARAMKPDASQKWLNMIGQNPDLVRYAILGMGASGDPAWVPALFNYFIVDDWARVAGESFSMITGADLEYEALERDWPEGFEAGPTENPEDEDVEMDGDEDLPWPDPERITSWWESHKGRFHPGVRFLAGYPITLPAMEHVLKEGFQRQRIAAAFEKAMIEKGISLFETRAPGYRQQSLLSRAAEK